MNHYKAVLFDCDGVLIDTEPVWFEVLKAALAECHLCSALEPAAVVGKPLISCIELLESELGVDLGDDFGRRFRRLTTNLPDCTFVASEAAEPVLSTLIDRHVPIAVVSNSPHRQVRRLLSAGGLGRFFSDRHIISGPEIQAFKPDPAGYLLAAQVVQVPIANCLIVEDSEPGLKAAVAAGAGGVLAYRHVCSCSHHPDSLSIDSLKQVLEQVIEVEDSRD